MKDRYLEQYLLYGRSSRCIGLLQSRLGCLVRRGAKFHSSLPGIPHHRLSLLTSFIVPLRAPFNIRPTDFSSSGFEVLHGFAVVELLRLPVNVINGVLTLFFTYLPLEMVDSKSPSLAPRESANRSSVSLRGSRSRRDRSSRPRPGRSSRRPLLSPPTSKDWSPLLRWPPLTRSDPLLFSWS